MALALRPIEPADVPEAGRICHEAFTAIAAEHNFPSRSAIPMSRSACCREEARVPALTASLPNSTAVLSAATSSMSVRQSSGWDPLPSIRQCKIGASARP